MSLIEQIEAAEGKDELEVLGKKHLSIDVDKRKGAETIRAELLEAAESHAAGDTPADAPEPEASQAAAPQEGGAAYQGRLLKHRKTGRLLPWTAALAKKRDMQEV